MLKRVVLPDSYTYITAFLSMRCNLECSFCLNLLNGGFSREKFNEIPGEEWVTALNRIKPRKGLPVTLSGGEPKMHKDFIYIINNLNPELEIDVLTNLCWGKKGIDEFISKVNPNRLKRDSPYASIRVSYHPEQMGDGSIIVENSKRLQDAGFSIGIWAVMYPSSQQLSSINQMQFRCKENNLEFRLKEFTGKYKGELYGDYSKYNNSILQDETKHCLCKIKELLIGPNGDVYKCHRDLYKEEFPIGNITLPEFQIESKFRPCDKYGQCHPCDVKVKTSHKQKLGYTSVDIKDIK